MDIKDKQKEFLTEYKFKLKDLREAQKSFNYNNNDESRRKKINALLSSQLIDPNANNRLQTQLAHSKTQINYLNQIITKKDKEIIELKDELEKKDNEGNSNSIMDEEDNSIKHKNFNAKMIKSLFDIYNSNISLFSSSNKTEKLIYEENNDDKNFEETNNIIVTIQSFIKKIMNENVQMKNELNKYKVKPNLLNNMSLQNFKDLKLENSLLKQQINGLVEQLKIKEDEFNNLSQHIKRKKKINLKKRPGSCAKVNESKTTFKFNFKINSNIEPIQKLESKINDLDLKIKMDDKKPNFNEE